MGDLMGGEIVQHIGRREDQAPGKRQRSGRSARTPAARLIADRYPLDPDAEVLRVGERSLVQILACFALEEVVDAPVHVLDAAGYTQNLVTAVAGFGPHRAAFAGAMHDPMRYAAQWNHGADLKRRRLRQAAEAR